MTPTWNLPDPHSEAYSPGPEVEVYINAPYIRAAQLASDAATDLGNGHFAKAARGFRAASLAADEAERERVKTLEIGTAAIETPAVAEAADDVDAETDWDVDRYRELTEMAR